jgi:hypothetical protein
MVLGFSPGTPGAILGNPPSGSQPTSVKKTRNITTDALNIDALLSAITTATASASDRSKAAYGRSLFGFDSLYYHCAFPATRGQAGLSRTKKPALFRAGLSVELSVIFFRSVRLRHETSRPVAALRLADPLPMLLLVLTILRFPWPVLTALVAGCQRRMPGTHQTCIQRELPTQPGNK